MGARASLPAPVAARLQAGVAALVLSADARGDPHSTYSWAVAVDDGRRVRFGVDRGSTTSANLSANGRAAVVVVGSGGLNVLLGGRARRLRAQIEAAAPIPLELWELALTRLKDQSWPGVTTSALAYRWPADRRAAMRRIEKAVFAAMRDEAAVRARR